MMKKTIVIILTAIIIAISSCSKQNEETVIRSYPVSDLEGIVDTQGIVLDKEITSDGNGSFRITVNEPATINIYETGDIDIENAILIYRAAVRTENVDGSVYLEMWCNFESKGQYFSRGLQTALTGTTDWIKLETPFIVKQGQNPDNVKLNLVINGKGSAWIDDIQLLKMPLE